MTKTNYKTKCECKCICNPIKPTHDKTKRVKICFFFDATGASNSAERSETLPELNQRLFKIQGISGQIIERYIGIKRNEAVDLENIRSAVNEGYTIFCSALGSAFVLYLEELFFNQQNEESGIVHVNSFSTSIRLNGFKNLIRLLPEDVFTPEIFVYAATDGFTNNGQMIIVYNPGTVFGASLADSVIAVAQARGVPYTPIIVPFTDPESIIPAMNAIPPSTLPTTVLIISDFALQYTDLMRTTAINENIPQFQLMYTDANTRLPDIPADLLAYIQAHGGNVLQYYLSPQELRFIIVFVPEWNSTHPNRRASSQVMQYMKAIDISTLLHTTRPDRRNSHKFLGAIPINLSGSNSNYMYGLYTPRTYPIIDLVNIYTVYNGRILSVKV